MDSSGARAGGGGVGDGLEVLRLAAFTDDPDGGNPAGVVIAEQLPSSQEMQRVAAEVGYSETAFLADLGGGRFAVRYHSPVAEVPFCGHATIASGVALGERVHHGDRLRLVFETRVGEVSVEVAQDVDGTRVAALTSVEPRDEDVADAVLDAALGCFGWMRDDLDPRLPPAVAFAGAHHLVLPLRSRATLAAMAYDFEELRDLMLDHDWTTVAVVWRKSDEVWHARNPFPVGGVVEDPATGAAAAALGGYVRSRGLVEVPARLVVHQGDDLGRPSLLRVAIPEAGGITVSGTAVPIPG